MAKSLFLFLAVLLISGCSTKMAYLNTGKQAEEVQKDKAYCQSAVDASDFKDEGLKRNKFNQCMKDRGYKVVSEGEAEKTQGLKCLWIKPGADFKAYEAVFIDKVGLSGVEHEENLIPDTKISDEDINNLGVEMRKRFANILNAVMPVLDDKGKAPAKKTLYIKLNLDSISQTNVGLSVALQAAGQFSPVPLPGAPEGGFSFEGEISDYSTKEKLMAFADVVKGDKNASLIGTENYTHWQKAFNVMDYWADKLAGILTKERKGEYKSQLGFKVF